MEEAITTGAADVRGYYHWSLVDNFEWASGYYPKFGLMSYDPVTRERTPRRSARIFKKIAKKNAILPSLINRYGSK